MFPLYAVIIIIEGVAYNYAHMYNITHVLIGQDIYMFTYRA